MRLFTGIRRGSGGFTLVELLLAMVVSSVIMLAIYSAQRAQQRTHNSQEQVADLQQSIRAAMTVMTNDIHAAGFKPTGDDSGDIIDMGAAYLKKTKFEIKAAEKGKFAFTRYVKKLKADGSVDREEAQEITYSIAKKYDDDGDGVVDDRPDSPALGRSVVTCDAGNSFCANISNGARVLDPVARDLEAVEFVYHLCPKDRKGLRYYTGEVSLNPAKKAYEDICAVTVSLLLRSPLLDTNLATGIPVPEPASSALYSLSNDEWKKIDVNDQHRRRLYTTTVQLRNTHLIKSN